MTPGLSNDDEQQSISQRYKQHEQQSRPNHQPSWSRTASNVMRAIKFPAGENNAFSPFGNKKRHCFQIPTLGKAKFLVGESL